MLKEKFLSIFLVLLIIPNSFDFIFETENFNSNSNDQDIEIDNNLMENYAENSNDATRTLDKAISSNESHPQGGSWVDNFEDNSSVEDMMNITLETNKCALLNESSILTDTFDGTDSTDLDTYNSTYSFTSTANPNNFGAEIDTSKKYQGSSSALMYINQLHENLYVNKNLSLNKTIIEMSYFIRIYTWGTSHPNRVGCSYAIQLYSGANLINSIFFYNGPIRYTDGSTSPYSGKSVTHNRWYKVQMILYKDNGKYSNYEFSVWDTSNLQTPMVTKTGINVRTTGMAVIDKMTLATRTVWDSNFNCWFDKLDIISKEYQFPGHLRSKPIALPKNMSWDSLYIKKTESTNCNIYLNILNATNDQLIYGGITANGEISIRDKIDSNLYPSIKLDAIFNSNGIRSPTIVNLGISWNASDTWRDTLFGGLKVESKNNVNIVDGKVEFEHLDNLTSSSINISDKCYYDTLIINKTEPTGTILKITVLDAQTNAGISGYKDLTKKKIDLTNLDPQKYPRIKLKAVFTGPTSIIGTLYDWSVNWTKNNAPEIIDITSVTTVNRTRSICIKTNLTDPEEAESALTFETTYKSPSDNDWQTMYMSSPNFINDHWEFIFTPPADAELGQYSFRFSCNDTFQESAMEMDSNFLRVINNEPIIQNVDISTTEINRTKTVDIKIVATDVEIPMNELIVSIKYKSPFDTNWIDNYISNLAYVNGHWEAEFTPIKNADLGNYSFKIICNDTDTEVLMEYDILVKNNKPIIWEITPSKYQIYRTETMKIIIKATDVEKFANNLEIGIEYKPLKDSNWKVIPKENMAYINEYWEVQFTPLFDATLGMYDFIISCNDSVSEVFDYVQLQVLNNIPSKPAITIIPPEPTTVDDLTIILINKANEIERPNQLEYWYRWYIDEKYSKEFDNKTVIISNATSKFQTWRCVIQPFDGDDFGPANSAEVTILNSLPRSVEHFEYYEMSEDSEDILQDKLSKLFSDDDNDDLIFSATGQKYINIEITQENGTIKISPTENWFGTEYITFYANDSFSKAAQKTVEIIVIPKNDLPEIVQVGNQLTLPEHPELDFIVDQDNWLNLTIVVEDIDGDLKRGAIKHSLNISNRKNLYIENNEIIFLPENDDVGWHYLNIHVTDGNETPIVYISQPIRILVKNVNDPPSVIITKPRDGLEFLTTNDILLTCSGDDPDLIVQDGNENLTYNWYTNKSAFEELGTGKDFAILNKTLPPGFYNISVIVTDSGEEIASDYVHIIVKEAPKEKAGTEKSTTSNYLWLGILLILIILIIFSALLIVFSNKKKRQPSAEEILQVPQQELLLPDASYRPPAGALSATPSIQRTQLASAMPTQELLGPSVPTPAGVTTQPQAQLPPVQPAPQYEEQKPTGEVELTPQQKLQLLEERLLTGEIDQDIYLNLKAKYEMDAKPYQPMPQLPPASTLPTTPTTPTIPIPPEQPFTPTTHMQSVITPPIPSAPQEPTMQPGIMSQPPVHTPLETIDIPAEVPPTVETPTEAAEPPIPIELPPDAYQQPQIQPPPQFVQQPQVQQPQFQAPQQQIQQPTQPQTQQPVQQQPQPIPQPQTTPTPVQALPELAACPQCGGQLTIGTTTCPGCSAQLTW